MSIELPEITAATILSMNMPMLEKRVANDQFLLDAWQEKLDYITKLLSDTDFAEQEIGALIGSINRVKKEQLAMKLVLDVKKGWVKI